MARVYGLAIKGEVTNLEPDLNLSGTVHPEFNVIDALSLEPQFVQVVPQPRLHADTPLRTFVSVRNSVPDQAGDHHRIVRCRPHRLVRCACSLELKTPQSHEVRHKNQRLGLV